MHVQHNICHPIENEICDTRSPKDFSRIGKQIMPAFCVYQNVIAHLRFIIIILGQKLRQFFSLCRNVLCMTLRQHPKPRLLKGTT
jgi:hypothetical protein